MHKPGSDYAIEIDNPQFSVSFINDGTAGSNM